MNQRGSSVCRSGSAKDRARAGLAYLPLDLRRFKKLSASPSISLPDFFHPPTVLATCKTRWLLWEVQEPNHAECLDDRSAITRHSQSSEPTNQNSVGDCDGRATEPTGLVSVFRAVLCHQYGSSLTRRCQACVIVPGTASTARCLDRTGGLSGQGVAE